MTVGAPRLRVERLRIVESRSPIKFIRDVPLHAGLNIVWACELPAAATEVDRAGHGVGKTTFSLMVRAVLGDDGAAVRAMRGHLAEHYGSGGIAAEVVAGSDRFAVFRSFGSHSFVLKDSTLDGLFEEGAKAGALDFSTYVAMLGERACLQYMAKRALPVTGQVVEWEHVLCWIARDQALGLRQYFEWRNDDGAGLRRKVKDPPALVRLVLGLFTDAEVAAEEKIWSLSDELSRTREALGAEEQRGENTRGIIETQLRKWAGVSNSLRMVTDDLFSDSVEQEIRRKTYQLESENQKDRAEVDELDGQIAALAGEIQVRERLVELAKARWDEAIALRNRDEKALNEIRERRDKLLTLSGMCQYGGVAYSDCRHVQEQRSTLKLSAARDVGVLSKSVDERQEREVAEEANYEREAEALARLTTARDNRLARKTSLADAIGRRLRRLGQSDAIREALIQWEDAHQGPETEKLRTARTEVRNIEQKLEAAKWERVVAQHHVSEHERQLTKRIARLAEVFGANGRYVALDAKRPFQMLGADGDAYTVLEILLGDLACAEDGAEGGVGAHPGLLIFDCPREREMSPHLYERFLKLVHEVCERAPGLQVIITTTTPPPDSLREPPTPILKLSRASEGDLLLRRHIENLLSRTTLSPDVSEENGSRPQGT